MASGRIDVHFHVIPPVFRDAVLAAGKGPTLSTGFPAWTTDVATGVMDRHGIGTAILSISQPGVHLGDDKKARNLARACNDYMADCVAKRPTRFGAFAAVPLPDVEGARAEIMHALDTLKLDGVGLLASYGERFLGDPLFDPVLKLLDERAAAVFIHPNFHPSSRGLKLDLPAFVMEFLFDTTRAAVNLIFSGALEEIADPSRILFGSDWPYAPEAVTAETVKTLAEPGFLDSGRQAAINRGNALALFPRLG